MTLKVGMRVMYSPPGKDPVKATIKKVWKSGETVTIVTQSFEVVTAGVKYLTPADDQSKIVKDGYGFKISEVRDQPDEKLHPNQVKSNELSNLPIYYWRKDNKYQFTYRLVVSEQSENDPMCEDVSELISEFQRLLKLAAVDIPQMLLFGEQDHFIVEYADECAMKRNFLREQLTYLGLTKDMIKRRLGSNQEAIAYPNQPENQYTDQNSTILVRDQLDEKLHPNHEKSDELLEDTQKDDQEKKKPTTRYWYEQKYINKKGKQCGPYWYKRWLENGKTRSQYIGKHKPMDVAC